MDSHLQATEYGEKATEGYCLPALWLFKDNFFGTCFFNSLSVEICFIYFSGMLR